MHKFECQDLPLASPVKVMRLRAPYRPSNKRLPGFDASGMPTPFTQSGSARPALQLFHVLDRSLCN
jgi:hypothetical protein